MWLLVACTCLVESLLGQLFADVEAEHVDTDAGERHAPAVRQEEFFLWRVVVVAARARLALARGGLRHRTGRAGFCLGGCQTSLCVTSLPNHATSTVY